MGKEDLQCLQQEGVGVYDKIIHFQILNHEVSQAWKKNRDQPILNNKKLTCAICGIEQEATLKNIGSANGKRKVQTHNRTFNTLY